MLIELQRADEHMTRAMNEMLAFIQQSADAPLCVQVFDIYKALMEARILMARMFDIARTERWKD